MKDFMIRLHLIITSLRLAHQSFTAVLSGRMNCMGLVGECVWEDVNALC